MREIRTSGLMSGEGKRSVAAWPKPPRPSSTLRCARDGGDLKARISVIFQESSRHQQEPSSPDYSAEARLFLDHGNSMTGVTGPCPANLAVAASERLT